MCDKVEVGSLDLDCVRYIRVGKVLDLAWPRPAGETLSDACVDDTEGEFSSSWIS